MMSKFRTDLLVTYNEKLEYPLDARRTSIASSTETVELNYSDNVRWIHRYAPNVKRLCHLTKRIDPELGPPYTLYGVIFQFMGEKRGWRYVGSITIPQPGEVIVSIINWWLYIRLSVTSMFFYKGDDYNFAFFEDRPKVSIDSMDYVES